jgi:hypothetical protein
MRRNASFAKSRLISGCRALGKLGDRVTAALHAAGFAFNPKDEARTRSQNENRYTVWQLPYAADSGQGRRCARPSRSS